MSDKPSVNPQTPRKRSKNLPDSSQDSKKPLLLEEPPVPKDKNKDSAYYEDIEGDQAQNYDSLPRQILKIIDPEHSPPESFSYSFTTTGHGKNLADTKEGPPYEENAQGHFDEGENVNGQRSTVLVSEDSGSNEDKEGCNSSASENDENLVSCIDDGLGNDSCDVSVDELAKGQGQEIINTEGQGQRQSDLDISRGEFAENLSPNVEEAKPDESNLEDFEPESKEVECDWLLPTPVHSYFATAPKKHYKTRGKGDKSIDYNLILLRQETNNHFMRFLLFIADAQHIDDWLNHNFHRQFPVLQSEEAPGVISLTGYGDGVELPDDEPPQRRWPWYHNNRLLIHLRLLDDVYLHEGDTYLCVQRTVRDSDRNRPDQGNSDVNDDRKNPGTINLNTNDEKVDYSDLKRNISDTRLDTAEKEISGPVQGGSGVKQDITNQDITNLNQDISDPKQDISDPKQDISDPNQDISDPSQDISDPKQDIPDQKLGISKPKQDISEKNQDITDHTDHLDQNIDQNNCNTLIGSKSVLDRDEHHGVRTSQCVDVTPCLSLMLYTKGINTQSSYPLWQCEYSQLFTMDFVQNVAMTNPDDLAELLKHCLIAVETCTKKLTIKPSRVPCESCRARNLDTKCYHNVYHSDCVAEDNTNNNCEDVLVRPRILPAYKDEPPGASQGGRGQGNTQTTSGSLPRGATAARRRPSSRREARCQHQRAPDGRLVKAEPPPCTHTIPLPVTIDTLHQQALMSGAVLYPGCRDIRGAAVVIIFCRHPAWRIEQFTSQELAKILLYYYTVPREEISHKGLTVIADARGTTLPVLNTLLETLYTVEANLAGAVYISHVLADRVAQSLLFRSPVFRPQVNLRIDLVMPVDTLYKFVSPEYLPPELGGYLHTNHVSWIHYRRKLEHFVRQCREVGELLVRLMQEMAAVECLPSTAPDATHQVELHKQCVASALEGSAVVSLREQGQSVLTSLNSHQHDLTNNDDFRSSLRAAEHLYGHVQDTAVRLANLADDRLNRLQTCSQRHLLDNQITELLKWFGNEGAEILEKHSEIADNLKGIRNQQKDFNEAYFVATSQLEKGSDLMEEAKLLSQSEGSSEVMTGVKDMSADLKDQMAAYTGRLEGIQEKIEDTSRCYHLLDKSYEWALNAMKYAASVKTDKTSDAETIDRLLLNLDVYRKEHPPLDVDTFEMMLDLSQKLENDKLYDQCKVARTRCVETEQLLKERTAKLRQSKDRLETEKVRHAAKAVELELVAAQDHTDSGTGTDIMGHGSSTNVATCSTSPNTSDLSQTSDCSLSELRSPPGAFANRDLYMSHLMSVLRRRSYAGKPSAPLYSPGVAAFKDSMRDMNLWEYEEYLFHEGLITEDMSDRIVAFLPKGLSDSTMRGSRESLRGSIENLSQMLTDSPPQEPKSASLPRDLSASIKDDYKTVGTTIAPPPSLNQTLNKHHRPHKKMLKKASSCSLPETGASEILPSIREQRDIRSISMITGSTESLPCMPEEELEASVSSPHINTTCTTQISEPESPCTPPITTERKFGWSPVPVNTHLMYRHNRATSFPTSQSMADLRVAEDQVKRRRTLSLILHEMIQTERDYVKSLQFIIQNYLPEISRPDVPQTLRGKRSTIFGNLEKIYEFHNRHFLSDLEKCQANPYTVCHAFLKHDQEFFLYALYNKNKPKSDSLMSEYGMAFFRKKQVELGDRMDLNSYLLKPVQRMGKYALLLKQIIKECAETDQEFTDLNAAFEMVKFQLRHGNDLLAMDCLKDCDVNLQEQGMLLRQDEFLVWQGRKKCLRHVFLFEEMVLFSKPKRTSSNNEHYVYKNSIKTSDLGLTENVADKHKFEIWFRKRTAGGTFTLQAPTMDVKTSWVKEISMLLWKQAFRNRERRLSEAARMGIGRKTGMDLKASQHNIHDRFVNISIGSENRVPRMRNSIAVSSFDHLRNGSKRPHSLISVSSSSSGGSNQSSNSGGMVPVSTSMGALDVVHEDQRVPDVNNTYTFTTETSLDGTDLNTSLISNSSSMEDACTQTTLKRPLKRKDQQTVEQGGGDMDTAQLLHLDHIRTTDV